LQKKNIILVVARGEAVRNFIFSDSLTSLANQSNLTILSSVQNKEISLIAKKNRINLVALNEIKENSIVTFFRDIIHTAHYQFLWNTEIKYYWGRHNLRVKGSLKESVKLYALRILGIPLSNKTMLRISSKIEKWISWYFRPPNYFENLFRDLRPDLIFNCSHIHGQLADLPMRIASGMGISTSVFIFSWDNLSSRGRIFPHYDHYFVWNNDMCDQLLTLYGKSIKTSSIHITGTPQFDYHFNQKYCLKEKELYDKIGLKHDRPYILYTTGMSTDFPEEHKIVEKIIGYIKSKKNQKRVQLVVRTYAKGTSKEMKRLQKIFKDDSDIYFPPILWDSKSLMPFFDDLFIYSNLIRYSAVGINAASTVSLELMMFDKPVINIGFEPPESSLPYWKRFSRHITHAHYKPVVKSKSVMVARSVENLMEMIDFSIKNPKNTKKMQTRFLSKMFDGNIDGKSGERISQILLKIANEQ
tara:strand:+ start:327 stop:1739 length:1413 start_codon:yes stop_codon:yes gene_type:complete